MINHSRALTLAAFAIICLSACSNAENPTTPDEEGPTESVIEPETLARADIPVFPEDDIDWESLRYKREEQPTFDIEPIDGFEPYLPNHSLEQWQALDEDGKVSREDYEAGFYRFQACVEENGGHLNTLGLIKDQFDYSHSEFHRPLVDACYEYHYWLVDAAWQLNLPPKDDTYQINAYIDCFQEHGITPVHTEAITEAGDEQQAQLMELMDQAFEQATECL